MLLLEHARHKKVGPTKRLSIEDKYSTEWQKCWKEEFRNLLPPWKMPVLKNTKLKTKWNSRLTVVFITQVGVINLSFGRICEPRFYQGILIFLCQNQRELLAFLVRRTFQFGNTLYPIAQPLLEEMLWYCLSQNPWHTLALELAEVLRYI